MDAAWSARRLGSAVTVLYRKTQLKLPEREEEVEHAIKEGINFEFLTRPLQIIRYEDGWVREVLCEKKGR